MMQWTGFCSLFDVLSSTSLAGIVGHSSHPAIVGVMPTPTASKEFQSEFLRLHEESPLSRGRGGVDTTGSEGKSLQSCSMAQS